MNLAEVKQQLCSLVNRVYRKETQVMMEKSGIPVAGLVSAGDPRRLDRLDRERRERFSVLHEFAESFKDIPAEELEREVARSIAEVRAERREKREQAESTS